MDQSLVCWTNQSMTMRLGTGIAGTGHNMLSLPPPTFLLDDYFSTADEFMHIDNHFEAMTTTFTMPEWFSTSLLHSSAPNFGGLLFYYALLAGILVMSVTVGGYMIVSIWQSYALSDKRRANPAPLILKMFWLNNMAPPSHNGYDTNVYLTETDCKSAEATLQEMISFGNSVESVDEVGKKVASLKHGRPVPFASERDEDNLLMVPTRTYPRHAHHQFFVAQRALKKQLKTFRFGMGNNGSRLSVALSTWMAHLSAGIVSIVHAFLVVPVILFVPERQIRDVMVQPSNVVFCRNEPKVAQSGADQVAVQDVQVPLNQVDGAGEVE